jgi:hypothetical protein
LSTIVAVASGPYFAACGLLVVTGIAKTRQPRATADALGAAYGLRPSLTTARAIGIVEILVGIVGALVAAAGFAVALLFGAFLVVALRLRSRAPDAKCGCIGDRSGAVGVAHVVTGAAAALVALVYGAGGGDGIAKVIADQPLAGAPFVALTACCVGLVSLFLTSSAEERTWLH